MRENTSLVWEGIDTPAGAYASAKSLCVEAVRLKEASAGTKGAALDELTRQGDFGSWLKKLWRNETATIHLHYYERLVGIVAELAAERRRQAEHVELLIAKSRQSRDAAFAATGGARRGRVPSSVGTDSALVARAAH